MEGITEYSLKTASSEVVFFSVKPSNISVLSEENLAAKIYSLMTVLKGLTEIEILCVNSRESFESNKNDLRRISEKEENELLTTGNTVASIDEFYLFLINLTAVEYIRNFMKRVRKKESAVILASQNIEDFLVENVRELTKPLFSIPTHHFLFNAGTIDSKNPFFGIPA